MFFILLFIQGLLSYLNTVRYQDTTVITADFTLPGYFTAGIEGPAVDRSGNVYAVNFKREGTIGIVDTAGRASLFATLPNGSIGNSICITPSGSLLVADYTGHQILKIDDQSRAISVYAHQSEMNQPNDICRDRLGRLYASDPLWSDSSGQLWRIDSGGATVLLEERMGTTNGIALSPDEKYLYVNESIQRNVWRYDVHTDGSLSRKKLLTHFDDGGLDGMKCDAEGNLYIARYGAGTVAVISPEGESIREIQLTGKNPTNLTFGGRDGKTCYVTLQDRGCIEMFRVDIPGKEWMK